jgi:hypothetical protein
MHRAADYGDRQPSPHLRARLMVIDQLQGAVARSVGTVFIHKGSQNAPFEGFEGETGEHIFETSETS